ncbi:MAG TPA: hypothetical protein PL137_11595 [Nocardioides sp.]|nr:hypothetical protein [Nocardioides sp.]
MSKPPTAFADVEEFDAAGTLAAAEQAVRDRRAGEAHEVALGLRWADLHATLPHEPERTVRGGVKLVQLGGEGTPTMQDLAICELAIARSQHTHATRAFLADALDLRHRLPELYDALRGGQVDLWVARKVASMTRKLCPGAAGLVDRAVTPAVAQGPGRVLSIAEAKVIEADTAQARTEREEGRRKRYVAITPTDEETGLRTLIAAVEPADAVWLDAQVERVADALDQRRDLIPDLPENCTRDELRSAALGWLAHPEDVTALLAGEEQPQGNGATTRNAVVYVHLHQAALEGADAVARVEGLGPQLLDELTGLLGHARVTVAPVIDLAEQTSVNGYEHPQRVRERTLLRTIGDVFPHASTISRNVDLDHPDPYKPNGPPGQTGDHNAAPLGRRHHRAKTHLNYQVRQLGPGTYLWRTPHGLLRLVDRTGTHELDAAQALDVALDYIAERLRDPS